MAVPAHPQLQGHQPVADDVHGQHLEPLGEQVAVDAPVHRLEERRPDALRPALRLAMLVYSGAQV